MCTAISQNVSDHYFGRNLDYEHTFGETITVTPRRYPFYFRNGWELKEHYAMIGMAVVSRGYPLYFDATNEKGLSMAGLNFPEMACYKKTVSGKDNIASFELIPWILGQCASVVEAEELLQRINITDEAFSEEFPPSPLHFILADSEKSITLEQTSQGLFVCENSVGVLTNNPTFDMHMFYLSNFLSVSSQEPTNRFSDKIDLWLYSRGMGGIGLPGDLSSASRFVRACFTKLNSVFGETEEEIISQFFHVLSSVFQTKGCACVGEGYEMTNYSSCCNTTRGIYYYKTYYNSHIYGIDMHKENLEGYLPVSYEPLKFEKITIQN